MCKSVGSVRRRLVHVFCVDVVKKVSPAACLHSVLPFPACEKRCVFDVYAMCSLLIFDIVTVDSTLYLVGGA